MKTFLAAALLSAAFVVGCNAPTNAINRNNPVPVNNPFDNSHDRADGVMAYTVHPIMDSGKTAYVYLMPQGWKNEDQIKWVSVGTPYPLTQLVTKSNDGKYALAVFPMIAGASQSGPMGTSGQSYASAADAIQKIMAQDSQISNYQEIHTDTAATKSAWPANMGQTHAETAMTHFSCVENGIEKEGFVVCKLDNFRAADQYTASTLWHMSIYVMSAPKGELTTNPVFLKEAATFFGSASITPEYNQMINQIDFNAAQIARKTALQEDEQIMKNYWSQQKSMEQGMENFDNYIRDVSSYTNPNGGPPLTLPANGNYWIDSQGNVQNSPDPNFNPNTQGGGGNWQQLQTNPG